MKIRVVNNPHDMTLCSCWGSSPLLVMLILLSFRVRAKLLSSSSTTEVTDDDAMPAARAVDRYQARLDQLQHGSEDIRELTQKEYLNHVEKVSKAGS